MAYIGSCIEAAIFGYLLGTTFQRIMIGQNCRTKNCRSCPLISSDRTRKSSLLNLTMHLYTVMVGIFLSTSWVFLLNYIDTPYIHSDLQAWFFPIWISSSNTICLLFHSNWFKAQPNKSVLPAGLSILLQLLSLC